jgi:hypothetical protein
VRTYCKKHHTTTLGGTCAQCDEEKGKTRQERYAGVKPLDDPYAQEKPQTFALIVLVCGSRTYTDDATIRTQLAGLPPNTLVVHGCARGADSVAEQLVAELSMAGQQIAAIGLPANWDKDGKAAGPIRNQLMLDRFHPHVGLAFHDKKRLEDSKGTYDMVQRMRKAAIPVRVFGRGTKIRDLLYWRKNPVTTLG